MTRIATLWIVGLACWLGGCAQCPEGYDLRDGDQGRACYERPPETPADSDPPEADTDTDTDTDTGEEGVLQVADSG